MHSPTRPRPDDHHTNLAIGALLGAGLAAAGLSLAYMAIGTPLVTRLVPGAATGTDPFAMAVLVWTLTLIAGGAMLTSGTNRLASALAAVRDRTRRGSMVAHALAAIAGEVQTVANVVVEGGRPIPALVVGPFGIAIVHDMAFAGSFRRMGNGWETRTGGGWVPAEHPLDRVTRDVERVRHWLGHGDLDFVVRVYGALIAPDTSLPRSPSCAVITVDQIPGWIASLPRQRSLNAGRRDRLVSRLRGSVRA
ncbi:MAG: hypothetical protein H0T59_02525 [Chloroflexi bacterium]|nr:hypothetical protein [Chloroflexota bacterium]